MQFCCGTVVTLPVNLVAIASWNRIEAISSINVPQVLAMVNGIASLEFLVASYEARLIAMDKVEARTQYNVGVVRIRFHHTSVGEISSRPLNVLYSFS